MPLWFSTVTGSFFKLFKSNKGLFFLFVLFIYVSPLEQYAVYFCRAIRERSNVDPAIIDFFHGSAQFLETLFRFDGWVCFFLLHHRELMHHYLFDEIPDLEVSMAILKIFNTTPVFKLDLATTYFRSCLSIALYSGFETISSVFILLVAPDSVGYLQD